MRIEPPPSPPVASVRRPPATAAADPPDDPPGVWSRFQGLRVAPLSFVQVRLMPPNSLEVVSPNGTAPAPRNRVTSVESWSDVSSLSGMDASVAGQPATWSSSFTPIGTPPNGSDTSALPAARARRLGVEVRERVELGSLDRREGGVELLERGSLPGAERVDERAGVSGPRRVGHPPIVGTPPVLGTSCRVAPVSALRARSDLRS